MIILTRKQRLSRQILTIIELEKKFSSKPVIVKIIFFKRLRNYASIKYFPSIQPTTGLKQIV